MLKINFAESFDLSKLFGIPDFTSYSATVNFIIGIFYTVFAIMMLHFVFFAIVGIFKRKTYPHTDEKLKYGIIIPARNEEAVVGQLIDSIKRNKYPQDKLHIFLIAHNCDDNTAEIGRKMGATVYEYNNPDECTMGYAFKYLFSKIEEDYGTQNYDGFFLFNADNVLDENYFDKMNDAFVAGEKKNVITSFRNSKNFGSNTISACYGLYFVYGCRFESRGRTALGCSTRVQGTGYVVNAETVKNGWQYVTLTEDWEFTADQILQDTKIQFCDEAVFYDEQPTNLRVMWRQRLRWAKGHLLVCVTRLKDIIKGIFKGKKKGGTSRKGSTYDIMVNILPVCVITTALFLINTVLLCLSPLFGESLMDTLVPYLIRLGMGMAGSYALMILASIVIYIIEGKRIKGVKLGMKIWSCLIWPIFLMVSVPAEIVALFVRNLGWKTIPHTDTTGFGDLNGGCDEDKGDNDIEQNKISAAIE